MKLFQRLRYQIDKSLSRSFLSVIYILFILVFSVVLIITTIDFHSFEQSNGFIERFFDFFFASLIGESNDPNSSIINILINTTIAITGLFFSSVVIGLIVNIISDRIDEIRQGKSSIQESDHQLILGWSSGISLVMRELLLANENKTNANIVILDEMNPVEANEKIQHMFSEKKDYQKIVPKKGATYNRKHLNHVNLNAAKSIIINHNDDMKTIKTLAAIVNNPNRKEEKYNIVSKLNKKENYDLAKIIGGDEAQVLYFGDMLARIDAQTCLQTGLANVYLELVNFDGDEIYFHREKSLIGLSYGEAVISYDSSSIIGIERNSMILINPSFDEIIEANDNLIAISEDDDTVIKNGKSHTT
jgi:K+/H+ antiporter YhaU regulatory subunit KhtT